MNRTDRLVALVMLLQSRRVITAAEMADHFEITERTIYRDIAALCEAGVPIIGEAGVGYSLTRGYQLPPVMFSPEEAFALVTGGLLAERMTDDSVRKPIITALGKLTAVLPNELQNRVHRLKKSMHVGHFQQHTGPVSLSQVQAAMAGKQVMHLQYLGASRGLATDRVIEPLGLVYYLDHWHLIAWCRLRGEVRDFRVDRIIKCEILPEPSPPRGDFDLSAYLSSCTQPALKETAILHFHPRLIETVRRHWGPMLIREQTHEGAIRVHLSYAHPDHLARWLLSFGKMVTIISPDSLRNELIIAAEDAISHHSRVEKKQAEPILT
ncbi:helix-turn-helix transcriptional regulator [Luteolibacter algae]|uniref:Helix-turn-helix transcriptional regulator n=1 Tax=Luteolibacter algae TaxID=454151 RepID=A0ABW5D705_9BACT